MSLLTGRFLRLCEEAEPKHVVLPLRSRKTDHDVVQFFPPLQVGSTSSQSRASRNARLCQPVFRFAPHRQPQTRKAESLRCTPLPVYVGPRRSGQSLTLTWECQSNTALLPGQCQSRKDRYLSLQHLCVRLLPRPTALPPMPFVSGYSHGCRCRCTRPQTAQAI